MKTPTATGQTQWNNIKYLKRNEKQYWTEEKYFYIWEHPWLMSKMKRRSKYYYTEKEQKGEQKAVSQFRLQLQVEEQELQWTIESARKIKA